MKIEELVNQMENTGGYGYSRVSNLILLEILKELKKLNKKKEVGK